MDRILYAVLLAMAVLICTGPLFIPLLSKLRMGQNIRTDGPATHLKKQGTLTMGGIMIYLAFAVGALVCCIGKQSFGVMLGGVLFAGGFGLIGFVDDYMKVHLHRSLGLRAWQKIAGQILLSLGLAFFCYYHPEIGSAVYVPFIRKWWDLGLFYIPFSVFVSIATVNSTNLLDGLDGLLGGVSSIVFAAMAVISCLMASLLPDNGTVASVGILAGAACGACLGFLRYNVFPARIIMGDTGSMMIGGAVAFCAFALRLPLIIPIAGMMYLVTSVSDILQLTHLRFFGKRMFRMAPLHHHFEMAGIPETKIVAMYALVSVVFCLIGILSVM